MYSELFKTFSSQTENMMSPFTNYNEMLVKNIEETTNLQLEAMKKYADIGINQIKNATAVKDVSSLIEFNTKQAETFTELSQSLIEDGKRMSDIAQSFKGNLDELAATAMKKAAPTA